MNSKEGYGKMKTVEAWYVPVGNGGDEPVGQKDIAEKILEAYNDVFSDIVNVLLFNGEQILKENELED